MMYKWEWQIWQNLHLHVCRGHEEKTNIDFESLNNDYKVLGRKAVRSKSSSKNSGSEEGRTRWFRNTKQWMPWEIHGNCHTLRLAEREEDIHSNCLQTLILECARLKSRSLRMFAEGAVVMMRQVSEKWRKKSQGVGHFYKQVSHSFTSQLSSSEQNNLFWENWIAYSIRGWEMCTSCAVTGKFRMMWICICK